MKFIETNDNKENRVIYSYLAIYTIIGICIAIAAYQYVRNFDRNFKTNVENQLSLIADLKVSELEHWRDEQRGIAETLFENEAFANITKRYFKNPTNRVAKREIQEWMQEFQTAFNYDAVILTDPQLIKKIVFPETAERQKAYISPRNIDLLNAGKLVFEDFYRDDFKQKAFLKVLIPILDAHQLIGVIVLRIDPKTYLYSILANWPIPSKTSETFILRREDNKIVYLNELRFQKNSVLNLRIPFENKNVAGVRAVLGQKGFVEGVIDYRGKTVIAYIKKVPNSPWYLVVKEDDSEAYAPLRTDIWSLIILAFSVFLMIGLGLLFLWRHQRTLFYKERIKSAEALQKLNLAIYNSQEIVFLTDKEGIITYINPEFTKIYGYTAEEVVGKTTPRIINSGLNKKEDSKLLWDVLLNKQSIPKTEYFNKRKDGKLIEIEGSANPVIDQTGNIIGFLGIQRDITERKRSELEKQVMYEITHGVTTTSNLNELLKLIHQSLAKVLYADNIFIALYDQKTGLFNFPYWIDEFDPIPEPAAMMKSWTAYVFRTGKPILFTLELFQQLNEQNEVELVGSFSPSWIGVPLQTPTRTIGVLVLQHYKKENVYSDRDLQFLDSVGSQIAIAVERKLAEQELRQSEIKLNVILQSTADGILAIDGNGKVIKTNKRFADLLHIPQSLIDLEDNRSFINFVMNQLTHQDELTSKELKLYRSTDEDLDVLYLKDGRTFERYSVPMILNDSSIGRVWSLRDITERKKAEEEIKNKELQQKRIIESAGDAMYLADFKTKKILLANTLASQNLGYSYEELLTKKVTELDINYISNEKINERWSKMVIDTPVTIETKHIRKDGSTFPVEIRSSLIIYNGRKAMLGFVRDVSDRIKAEQLLTANEFKFRIFADFTVDLEYWEDENKHIVYMSPSCERLTGYTQNEFISNPILLEKIVHPDDQELLIEHHKGAYQFENRNNIAELEFRIIKKDGSVVNLFHTCRPIFDDDKKFLGRRVTNADITERIKAEEGLHESEIKLKVILESTADGILAVDGKGKVIKTNNRFAELWRIPQQVIDSGNDDDLVKFVIDQLTNPDEFISKMQKLYQSTDEDLDVLYFKDGRTFERFSKPMVMNDSSIGRVWSFRDITDRKRAEDELKNSQEQLKKFAIHLQNAREQDKILLATQLDNQLGQMLVALKMDIGMLKQKVAKGNNVTISADLFEKLDQAHNLIGNSINNTMKIMNDLRYEVLYLMGFIEGVNLYITEFQEENKITCRFESAIVKLDMVEKKATSLFRIFQNAMANVAKHSKATEVKINLYQTKEKLVLEITDNGIGFDLEKLSYTASNQFIYMKERTRLLKGELTVTSAIDQGTKVRVEIPYLI